MRTSGTIREVILVAGSVATLFGVFGVTEPARADGRQNTAVRGRDEQLYPFGFGGYTGTGVSVGVHEAGNQIPNYYRNGALEERSLLPFGNGFLPTARFTVLPQGGVLGPADRVGNHASTVAGTIVAEHPQQYGLARTSNILAAGFDIPAMGTVAASLFAGEARAAHITQGMAKAGTRIINQSWGIPQADPNPGVPPPQFVEPHNDGNGLNSRFTDWAARSKSGTEIRDLLVVVAGNQGSAGGSNDWGSASDAFNVLNIGATGRYDEFSVLRYDRAATYNRSNETADRSPFSQRGRINTHMVAPGGDPSGAIGRGTVGTPAMFGQFIGTSGGQVEFKGAYTNPDYAADPLTGLPHWETDDRAAVLGLFGIGLTAYNGLTWDNDPAGPAAPAIRNPGYGLRGGFLLQYTLSNDDSHETRGLGGTSFAAPLVSAAAANLVQYGTAHGAVTDHRVLKALLMNGARKVAEDAGQPLLVEVPPEVEGDPSTLRAWQHAVPASRGVLKPDLIRGGSVPLQVGLDESLGTGQLDMLNSFINYSRPFQGPGQVEDTGYGLASVGAGGINQYQFSTFGGEFRATLVWDRIVTLNDINANGEWDFDDDNGNDILDPGEAYEALDFSQLVDLDLELYRLDPLLGQVLVDFSTSDIDNAEHIWRSFLPAGTYVLAVLNQDFTGEEYALAWMVPTPSSLALLAFAGVAAARRRRTT